MNIHPLQSYIRILHASPDAPAVDIYVNDMLLTSNLAFRNFTNYLPVRPGQYKIDIYPAGKKNTPVFTKNVVVPPRTISTVAAVNRLKNLDLLLIPDPAQTPASNTAYLRIAHLSPNAPAVDVRADDSLLARNVKYKDITRYLPVDAGTYDASVYAAGTQNKALTIPNVVLRSGFYHTVYVLGLLGEKPPLQGLTQSDGLYVFAG